MTTISLMIMIMKTMKKMVKIMRTTKKLVNLNHLALMVLTPVVRKKTAKIQRMVKPHQRFHQKIGRIQHNTPVTIARTLAIVNL